MKGLLLAHSTCQMLVGQWLPLFLASTQRTGLMESLVWHMFSKSLQQWEENMANCSLTWKLLPHHFWSTYCGQNTSYGHTDAEEQSYCVLRSSEQKYLWTSLRTSSELRESSGGQKHQAFIPSGLKQSLKPHYTPLQKGSSKDTLMSLCPVAGLCPLIGSCEHQGFHGNIRYHVF